MATQVTYVQHMSLTGVCPPLRNKKRVSLTNRTEKEKRLETLGQLLVGSRMNGCAI